MLPRWLLMAVLSGTMIGCTSTEIRNPTRDSAHETRLSNGLRVIVKEDHRAPVVVSQIWYRVGAVDEPQGLTGISHVLEHMMFKGTGKLGPNEFSRIVSENGGRDNAFTSSDYTAYYEQLEKSRLPVAFELEADRMHNLKLAAAEFDKEVRVVMEERRLRTDDQPDSLAYEKFMATAFTTHPYRNPVIGWMPDLEKLKVTDLSAWYQRHYAPNNATLVVVGDVVPAEVVALAQKYFGDIPAYPLSPATIPSEPRQTETRRVRVQAPAEVPAVFIGFHVPAAQDGAAGREAWAIQVLAGVLDGGDAARFARELIRGQRVAASVDTGYDWNARYPTAMVFQGTPANGRSVEDLEKAILAQIARLHTEPVSDDELARVKAQVAAQNVFQRDSTFYQAMAIGQLAVAGLDWRMLDRYVDSINAVTAADVQAVARKYLVESNMTVAVLDPLPIDPKRPPRAGTGGGHVR